MSTTAATALQRFNEYVSPKPMSGCWLWTGAVDRKGYGHFNFNGRNQKAHRVAWALATGCALDTLCVLHRCDVPCCVNPDHLFLGTRADNNADRDRKGRTSRGPTHLAVTPRGEHNGASILGDKEVREIAALLINGVHPRKIGPLYGVTSDDVFLIKRGELWTHVTGFKRTIFVRRTLRPAPTVCCDPTTIAPTGGASRHYWRGELPCALCAEAQAVSRRAWRARRLAAEAIA